MVALGVRLAIATTLLISGVDLYHGNEPSRIAAHLAQGEGFSTPYLGVPLALTAQQPPLYPFLIAIVFKITGVYSRASLAAIVGLNAIAGAGVAALIYLVGKRYFSLTAAIISAWAWVGWSELVETDLFVITNYALFALAVLAWLLLLPQLKDRTIHWAFLGVSAGLGMLLNPIFVLVFVSSGGWLVQRRKQLVATAGLACLVVVSPWVIRNYRALHAFYPALRDNLGMELYIGNHPEMESDPQQCESKLCDGTANFNNADYPGNDPRLFAALGEGAFMQRKEREAVAYIRSDPARFLLRAVKRAASFWLLPHPFWRFAIFTFAGAWVIWGSSGPQRLFLAVLFGTYPVVFYLTQVAWVDYYRHPIEPLILLSAAAGGEFVYQKLRPAKG